MRAVIVDANLLLLLIVGTAGRKYIAMHKRLNHFAIADFEKLTITIMGFFEIVLLPHIVAEVSSLYKQIDDPALSKIRKQFKTLVETTTELPARSINGVRRDEFQRFGVTDALLLHHCATHYDGLYLCLLTADGKLANEAGILGYDVMNFRHL